MIVNKKRILSIDTLRALTMFFMIFVNDLWRISEVPKWILHTKTNEDGMGFSDVIFPLFLFIVGLSIPLAIHTRIKNGESNFNIIRHILERSLALLVMGFFMVNYESINIEFLTISKYLWALLMALAVVLIWLDYKVLSKLKTTHVLLLKSLGIVILFYLAIIYKGGDTTDVTWMKPHWWGILGLIGWSYLLNALLYLIFKNYFVLLMIGFAILQLLNIQEFQFFESLPSLKIVVSASNHLLVLGGVLCTSIYLKYKRVEHIPYFLTLLSILSLIFVSYGFLIRPYFIISKNLATPSWTNICLGIALLSFVLVYLLMDQFKIKEWANSIKPAGTSTLTCYLIPYFIYPIMALTALELPNYLKKGLIGIISSLLFSWLIIQLVGYLENQKIRLKV